MGSYKSWEVTDGCIKGTGGISKPYRHYCPISDFELIVSTAVQEKQAGRPITKQGIADALEGKRLERNRVFRFDSHEYKIGLTFHVMETEGIISRQNARTGRSIGYTLKWEPKRIQTWMKETLKR